MLTVIIVSIRHCSYTRECLEPTWATGGRANLRDSSGAPLYSCSCSSSDGPSSVYAGRLY